MFNLKEELSDSEYEKALEGFKTNSPYHDSFRYKLDKWYDRMSYRYYNVIMFIMKYLRKSSIWINMKSRFATDSDVREWWAMHLMGITDEMLTNAKTGDLQMLHEIIEWELAEREL
tara:strand:+ start:299 stop:646 length:348 start_codon:yes stop_codon:yes gene_type:complete